MGAGPSGSLEGTHAALKDGLELAKQNGARTPGCSRRLGLSRQMFSEKQCPEAWPGGPRVAKWEHPTSVHS